MLGFKPNKSVKLADELEPFKRKIQAQDTYSVGPQDPNTPSSIQ